MHNIRRLFVAAALVTVLAGCGLSFGPNPTFSVVPEQLPEAAVGQPYEVEISGISVEGNDVAPLSLHTDDDLPPGLSLRAAGSGSTTAIVGTPTTAGTYSFTLEANAGSCTMGGCFLGTRDYTLVVAP